MKGSRALTTSRHSTAGEKKMPPVHAPKRKGPQLRFHPKPEEEHGHGGHGWRHRLGIEDVQSHEIGSSLSAYGRKTTRLEQPTAEEHGHALQKGLYITPEELPALEKLGGIDGKAVGDVYRYLQKTAFSDARISKGELEHLQAILGLRNGLNTTREEINRLRATVKSGFMYDPMLKPGFMTAHAGTSREGFSKAVRGQKTSYRKLSSPTQSYFIKEPRILKWIPLFGPMFARYFSNSASAVLNAVTFRSRRKRTVGQEISEALARLEEQFAEQKSALQRAELDLPKSTVNSFREEYVRYLREKAEAEKAKKAA